MWEGMDMTGAASVRGTGVRFERGVVKIVQGSARAIYSLQHHR